ncbi:hypothetical protein BaRGS_00037160 [Batillaria attramentaria]|uniref:Uncharacterized protein n=1 Tax=Batillaria attramentaria TaxID=370345 RepID=A0ABD0J9J3_9CAEN
MLQKETLVASGIDFWEYLRRRAAFFSVSSLCDYRLMLTNNTCATSGVFGSYFPSKALLDLRWLRVLAVVASSGELQLLAGCSKYMNM